MAAIKVLFYLVVLILVLALAYYTTRWLGNRMNAGGSTADMKILDRLIVGRDSSVMVVKVKEQVFLLGVSPSGIDNLGELEPYETYEKEET